MQQSQNVSWEVEYYPDMQVIAQVKAAEEDEFLHRRLYSLLTGYYCVEQLNETLTIYLNNVRFFFTLAEPIPQVLVFALQNINDIAEDLVDTMAILEVVPQVQGTQAMVHVIQSLHNFLQNIYVMVSQIILKNLPITEEQLQAMVKPAENTDQVAIDD